MYRGKNAKVSSCVFLLFLLYFYTTTTLTQNTSVTKWVGFCPYQAISCDTWWVSDNSTQYWHYLLRDNTQSHKNQFHKILPSWLAMPITIFRCQVSTCASDLSSVQSLSRVRLFVTPWIAACQASPSLTNSQSSVMPSSHLILCHLLLLLPPIPPSIRVFSNESTLRMRWPKYCSFSFSIIPSKETPRLISFRMRWLDLFAVQGTLKSLLQHHSSKASILRHSAFFTVQLSHPYMTTGKTIALTRQNFVGKGMSLLLNMLSRLVITFLPRSKHLLMSWLQSPSAVILDPPKIKSDTVYTVSPSISHELMTRCHDLSFLNVEL